MILDYRSNKRIKRLKNYKLPLIELFKEFKMKHKLLIWEVEADYYKILRKQCLLYLIVDIVKNTDLVSEDLE